MFFKEPLTECFCVEPKMNLYKEPFKQHYFFKSVMNSVEQLSAVKFQCTIRSYQFRSTKRYVWYNKRSH